jgi:hypothetical protein
MKTFTKSITHKLQPPPAVLRVSSASAKIFSASSAIHSAIISQLAEMGASLVRGRAARGVAPCTWRIRFSAESLAL